MRTGVGFNLFVSCLCSSAASYAQLDLYRKLAGLLVLLLIRNIFKIEFTFLGNDGSYYMHG